MLYFGHMPEAGKGDLKAQLAAEVAHIRTLRPDSLMAANAARDNWTVLESLESDVQVVDY